MEQPPTPLYSRTVPSRVIRLAKPIEVPSRLAELHLGGPRPVVVLVGGADGLDDTQLARLRPLFEEGLAPLADALGACVIDGGTDTGVMGLIGQARAKLGASFSLIGVSASGTVAAAGSATTADDARSLEPNHTHAVLVPGSRWGEESPWLAAVASQLAGDAPSVTVVINGGEVTFVDAARSVEAGRPVLVVAGSGRTADTMAAALQENGQDKRAAELAASWLLQAVDLGAGPHALARAVAGVLTTRPSHGPPPRPMRTY
jgi:SLOG in TRPM, prokaryote